MQFSPSTVVYPKSLPPLSCLRAVQLLTISGGSVIDFISVRAKSELSKLSPRSRDAIIICITQRTHFNVGKKNIF